MSGSWVTGHNLAGYQPESDTHAYATWKEAVSALADEMRDYASTDDEAELATLPEDAYDDDYPTMEAHVGAILRDDGPHRQDEDWQCVVPDSADRRVVFWIVRSDQEPDTEY